MPMIFLEIALDTWIARLDAARDLLLIRRFCISNDDKEEKRKKMLAVAVELATIVRGLEEEINRCQG